MENKTSEYFKKAITWNKRKDAEFPFSADIDQQKLTIRINDFPVHPLYTLLVDNKPISDFDDWPKNWIRS